MASRSDPGQPQEGTVFREYFESPAGWMEVKASQEEVLSILFKGQVKSEPVHPNPLTSLCTTQLKAYFRGERTQFELPLRLEGTSFQVEVWKAVGSLGYGLTTTYHALSARLNKPLAVRAVGAANGKNRLLIAVPCHRVIGADGSLVGYAGELWRKKWLLDMESRFSGKGQMSLGF